MPLDRAGDQLLVAAGAVGVRGVEEIDAELARPADRRDRRIRVGLVVERRHRRAAEPDRRHLQLPSLRRSIPPSRSAAPRQYDRAHCDCQPRGEPPCRATSNSTKAKLDAEQRRIWNDCKAGPRGSVPPPVHVWLKSPGLADNAHKLGAHVRFGTPVHARSRPRSRS